MTASSVGYAAVLHQSIGILYELVAQAMSL